VDLAWDPAFITSNVDHVPHDQAIGVEQFDAIARFLFDGARCITAPTLLVRGALLTLSGRGRLPNLDLVPHAETVDVPGPVT